MTKEFKEAIEIANNIEEQIRIVDNELSYKRLLKIAIYTTGCMKDVIPMYTGNLNPKWKTYDTVMQILISRLNGG